MRPVLLRRASRAAALVLGTTAGNALAAAAMATAAQPTPNADAAVLEPCFDRAAQRWGLHGPLLRAIARAESGLRPGATHRNADGTVDYGLMQVNAVHLPRLAGQGIDADRLLADPCTNIDVGAGILADFTRRHGMTWRAVGAYNAGSAPGHEAAQLLFVLRVRGLLERAAAPLPARQLDAASARPARPARPASRPMRVVE